jgi:uncharacterized membrane protein YvlD (DUF360 family)
VGEDAMIRFIVDIVLTAIFLRFIANTLPDLEVDGFGPAVVTAVIMSVVGTGLGFALSPLLAPYLRIGGWVAFAVSFAVSVVVLMIALNVVPGVKVDSMASVVIAAVLLAALRTITAVAMTLVNFSALLRTSS